jgi:hypothetical protein
MAWASKFRSVKPDARIIVLCTPAEKYKKLEVYGAELIDCPDLWRQQADPQSLCRDRWDVMAREFDKLPDDSTLLVTDMGDVIFQRDPFEQIAPEGVTVATEGVLFKQNGWGTGLAKQFLPDNPEMMDFPIVCAGVWAAPIAVARSYVRDVYEVSRSRPGGVDQHCMNLVLHTKYKVNAIPYSEAWCAHCSLMYAGKPNTGPDNYGDRSEERPIIRNGQMVAEHSGKLFAIVHHVWLARWPGLSVLGGGRKEW